MEIRAFIHTKAYNLMIFSRGSRFQDSFFSIPYFWTSIAFSSHQ